MLFFVNKLLVLLQTGADVLSETVFIFFDPFIWFAVAIIFHTNFNDEMQIIYFLKDIAIAGGFIIIVANKVGVLTLDHYLNLNKNEID